MPPTVVAYSYQSGAALFDIHLDAAGTGVDAVLDELLHHGGGTFDHFTGGDLVDQLGREGTDAGHGRAT